MTYKITGTNKNTVLDQRVFHVIKLSFSCLLNFGKFSKHAPPLMLNLMTLNECLNVYSSLSQK